jgi:hypothetical protein
MAISRYGAPDRIFIVPFRRSDRRTGPIGLLVETTFEFAQPIFVVI